MPRKTRKRRARVRARRLCRHFEDTDLAGCAAAGLMVLEAAHKSILTTNGAVACGVALDRCRQHSEPDVDRWDYVFTLRGGNSALAVEVHHADADQATKLVAKKRWAQAVLAARCPQLTFDAWIWIASPPAAVILFDRLHPAARQLAEAGISYPMARCKLP